MGEDTLLSVLRPDVVEYLREHLPKFPVEALRRQLREEGVPEDDFQDSLSAALRAPKASPGTKTAKRRVGTAAKALLSAAVGLLTAVGIAIFARKSPPPARPIGQPPAGESGYVGARGWVVRLPKDYAAVSEFKDAAKTHEIIHFCKLGTDPTNFLNEGLFGQLGIVRLEVMPTRFPANPTGVVSLSNAVAKKMSSQGEKYIPKNIHVGTLLGVQINVQSPFPRVEAFVLGQNELYYFYAGQEDEIWRDIVFSLRDAQSEN